MPVDKSKAKKSSDFTLDAEVLLTSEIQGYRPSIWKTLFYYFSIVVTCGLLFVIGTWFRKKKAQITSIACSAIDASFFIVEGLDGTYEICHVEEQADLSREMRKDAGLPTLPQKQISAIPPENRMFIYRHSRFLFDPSCSEYVLAEESEMLKHWGDTHDKGNHSILGYTQNEAASLLKRFGRNIIDVPMKSVGSLLVQEVLHPFFVFQLFSICVWLTEEYYYYCGIIFFIATVSAVSSLVEIRSNMRQVKELSRHECHVTVLRRQTLSAGNAIGEIGDEMKVLSSELVPGDVLVVEPQMRVPCDAVLVRGQCVVNEAMLTGESVVVIKSSLNLFNGIDPKVAAVTNAEARNTLFGGTNVVGLRVHKDEKVLAVVVRTGFQSVKGQLVLAILYPKPTHFKFVSESLKFVGSLLLFALIGFAVNVWQMVKEGATTGLIVQRACDIVTIVIPPALPLAMSVGVAFALLCLKEKRIFCISPPRVNFAGKINMMCFDKTGTLTEEGLDLSLIRPAEGARFLADVVFAPERLPHHLLNLCASCHTLTHVDHKISGDPLEIKTFAFTRAALHEPQHAHAETWDKRFVAHLNVPNFSEAHGRAHTGVGILRQFEFIPKLQRMSVVVAVEEKGDSSNEAMFAYVKGSPEAIRDLSDPATVPSDFASVLSEYTRTGHRVLAAAYKPYPNFDATVDPEVMRPDVESGLTFLGFIVMENKLKPQTHGVLKILREEAAIRCCMITGDNAVTAVCVAKECGLVQPGHRVFIADMETDEYGSTRIAWRDFDDHSSELDPVTLLPRDPNMRSKYVMAMTGKAFSYLSEFHKAQQTPSTQQKEQQTPDEENQNSKFLPHPHSVITESRVDLTELEAQTFSEPPKQDLFSRAIMNSVVFARMAPDHKCSLVEGYQELGMYVGMCGDGANDSMALRAAHVGVSLSQVEASVSAPFTSLEANIECIPIILREGRSALATSFQLFRFMALYSMIQFSTAILLILSLSFLGNWMYLFADLYLVFILSLTLGRTMSADKLTVKRPSGRLFSFHNLFTTFGHILFSFGFQAAVYVLVKQQSWYGTPEYPSHTPVELDYLGTNTVIPETSSLFFYSSFQYLIVAILFARGFPYKKPIFTNVPFFSWWVVGVISSVWVLFTNNGTILAFLEAIVLPTNWRVEMLIILAINVVVSVAFELVCTTVKHSRFFSANKSDDKLKPYRKLLKEWENQMSQFSPRKSY